MQSLYDIFSSFLAKNQRIILQVDISFMRFNAQNTTVYSRWGPTEDFKQNTLSAVLHSNALSRQSPTFHLPFLFPFVPVS